MLKHHPTTRFILQRAGWYFLTFLVAVAINFVLPRMGSADPVAIIMGKSGQGLTQEEARNKADEYSKQFGLVVVKANGEILRDTVISSKKVFDEAKGDSVSMPDTLIRSVKSSLLHQFGSYVNMTLHGDLGTSFQNSKTVLSVILDAVPWTIALQLPTILFGWIVGNLLGALAAYKRGTFDRVFFPMALLMSAVPFFVFGMLLVYFFAVMFPIFPAMGGSDPGLQVGFNLDFFLSLASHYILPFFSIFLISAGGQAIGMRSMGIYELGTDYIKYAKWLGLKENRVLMYLFRNAMLPQLTGLALSLGGMIGGALITEMIFSYPGLGMSMLNAIQFNDYPMIQGVTLIITVCVLIANFTVDILIAFLDPRVKAGLKMGGN